MADNTNTTSTPATQAQAVSNGDAIAQSKGYADAAAMIESINSDLNSSNGPTKLAAEEDATDFTSKLIYLTLYQTIDGYYRQAAYKFANKFESEKIDAGNTKQFMRIIATGSDNYAEDAFIPSKLSKPQLDSATIQLYNSANEGTSKALSTYGFKFLKPLTISKNMWLPYFTSGKLQEFIDEITKLVNTSFEYFRIGVLQQMITDAKTNIAKKVTGSATNLLTALTQEVYPMLTEMNAEQSDYNINLNGTSSSINSTARDDLLIFVSNNVYTKLTGALANVYNNELASISRYINEENIIPCYKKIVVGDSDTPITTSSDYLMSDTEILVLNKNSIKQLYWVKQMETQTWAQNMTMQVVMHVWGAFGFLPWGQGFYYSNPNLAVLPS